MDISAYQHMNIRMSTRGKRPLRNLTPSDKVRAIQRIHNGETKASVSRDIGVPESTLRGWCKNEQKLRFMCRQLGSADQLTPLPCIENPPEKRPRFDNHIKTPKYPSSHSFHEFGYNRLSVNGLSFASNGSNAILERITLNDMKKHNILSESNSKQLGNISLMSGSVGNQLPMSVDYNSQLSIMQNFNLLSLLSPNLSSIFHLKASGNDIFDDIRNKISLDITEHANDNIKSNNSDQSTIASLSVKNLAKDPAEQNLLKFSNNITNNNILYTKKNTGTNYSNNDSNNNNVKEEDSSAVPDVLNFLPTLPLGVLQVPSISNVTDCESDSTAALLEWYKVFNASLNFLTLAATAAALQHNVGMRPVTTKNDHNILYKEITKTANLFDMVKSSSSLVSSDVSNDSYFDSEPEDLSVQSTATSKLSSLVISHSDTLVKTNSSCSPDG